MTGQHSLKQSQLSFNHAAQCILQCTAIQSLCNSSASAFSCVLTNLKVMYVVRVDSFNGGQIAASIFKAVTDEREIVRALLKAADDNEHIAKKNGQRRGPIVCDTTEEFDVNRPDPEHAGIPQCPSSTDQLGEAPSSRDKAAHDQLEDCHFTPPYSSVLRFSQLLPLSQHQKFGIRANYTRTWLRQIQSHRTQPINRE